MIESFCNIRRAQYAIVLCWIGLESDPQLHRTRYRSTNLQRQLRIQHVKGIVSAVDLFAENIILSLTINDLRIFKANRHTFQVLLHHGKITDRLRSTQIYQQEVHRSNWRHNRLVHSNSFDRGRFVQNERIFVKDRLRSRLCSIKGIIYQSHAL